MPDPIAVLAIAWMVLGVACVFAIEFGAPGGRAPAARRDRRRRPDPPAPTPSSGTTGAGYPQPEPSSTPAADHAGRSRPCRPRLRP